MRTSVDILNYFKRRQRIRKYRKILNGLLQQISILQREVQRQKDWQTMYSQLIERLQNVPKYCALKDPEQIAVNYPLERFATFKMAMCTPSKNPVLQQSHAENMYYAEMIVHDFVTEDLIHFEISTAEGIYAYQYSKKGIAIQPFKMILKEVTWMLTHAWFDQLHLKKGK